MIGWLGELQALLAHGDAAVLLTVARAEGDAPRHAGTKMIVARDRLVGSIGGGGLEVRAVEIARQMLRDGDTPRLLQRFGLDDASPGSAAVLAFERLSVADLPWVSRLAKRAAVGTASVRTVGFGDPTAPVLISDAERRRADCLLWDAGPLLTETIVDDSQPLYIVGAGPVARALVGLLAPLPFKAVWVDDVAPTVPDLPPNVQPASKPMQAIGDAPADAFYLLATDSEPLDVALLDPILRRGDAAFVAVLGTPAKRRRCEMQLASAGIDPGRLAPLAESAGIAGIADGAPAVMAISVAAQLLRARDALRNAG
ncbi:xanthine dehydrogenase accessory protein XdhC [Chitinasiproducens palmae]|uniref:Molybdenum cofactor sulfurylase n=1 Tax=Chitinasiproducens palmae TaxID=1770053 RepID=A0A1H2PV45_9BURK|nr:xanthine dehydrogenase accessory protein XdhC [Chitinasiproducens palmae]SDV51111.1 molybdenum cofactor sulfurylase [Chitinasiproducens palmae]